MSIYFAEKSWPELQRAIEDNALVLIPVGTIEEHGKHLPVNTDCIIAEEVSKRVAEIMKEEIPILVMPTVWTGYSEKKMMKWPGTCRISVDTFMNLCFDLCSSLIQMGFRKIVLINGHGHNAEALRVVARKIADAYDVFITVTDVGTMASEIVPKIRKSVQGGSIHGGEYETSLMLYLKPELVHMEFATNKDIMRYHSKFYPGDNFVGGLRVFWSTWGIQESKTGIYGDPTVASKETGEEIMKDIIRNYVEFLGEFYKHRKEG
jgi:creatinine amidohydrolase